MADDSKFVRGAEKLRRRIQTIRDTLGVKALTTEIGDLLLRRTLDRFDKQVDPDGRPWTPLAQSTLERRKRAGGRPGMPILRQSGELRGSIKLIRTAVEAGTATYVNTGAGVRIGVEGDSDLIGKARAHQKGYKPKGIPIRRFMGVGRLDITAVDGLMRRAAKKAMA